MTSVAEPPVEAASPAPVLEFKALLPYAPESARKARGLVEGALRSWELDTLIENAVLVADELVSNAIQTGCRLQLALSVERISEFGVRISVEDGSRYPPILIKAGLPADPDRVPAGGRGLVIVDGLCKRWGIDLRPLGKCVYAEIHAPRRSRR
ncbi:ATP-binding protein [Kitasatospora sp. NPDC056184]|uniref:ATP-binding protein n=1 Tax=Kitasatospora sp. NPDC056184 TaxID=3345738 RepID=UPI0035E1B471